MRYIKIGIVTLMALVVMIFGAWHICVKPPLINAAEAYIIALSSEDKTEALKISTGKAAYTASKLGNGKGAKLNSIESDVKAYAQDYAKVMVSPELELADKTTDVGWYELDLVKNQDGWLVANIQESIPPVSGFCLFPDKESLPAVEKVFKDYTKELANGNNKLAAKFLVGSSRRNMEVGLSLFKNESLIKELTNLTLTPQWEKDNLLNCRATYEIDGQNIDVSVLFVRLNQGDWKIAAID